MVGLPEFFKQTSDEPYDRHIYRFIDSNNNSIIVESYEQVHEKLYHVKISENLVIMTNKLIFTDKISKIYYWMEHSDCKRKICQF